MIYKATVHTLRPKKSTFCIQQRTKSDYEEVERVTKNLNFSIVKPLGLRPRLIKPTEDVTAKIIGDFGKWQLKISILMALLKLPNAWFQLNIVFMAPPQDFWCAKPETLMFSEEQWRDMCVPRIEERPCLIFDPDILGALPDMEKSMIPLVRCKQFVYDKSIFQRTITSDWDLVCTKHWYIHLTQCAVMLGVLVGSLVFGKLADKYGRKLPLMVGIVIESIFCLIASLMPEYWSFLFVWFIVALAGGGISIISFVICLETPDKIRRQFGDNADEDPHSLLRVCSIAAIRRISSGMTRYRFLSVSGKYRTTVPILHQMPFFFGNVIVAGLAYWLRDWRKLDISLALLSALYISYWYLIPESPRWLLAKGRTEEAMAILKEIAVYNNRSFPLYGLRDIYNSRKKHHDPGFMDFFRTKKMRTKTLLLSISWFCSGLSFYTFSQYLGGFGGNIFVTISITGIISCFGGILCVCTITRMGRKTTVGVYQLTTALCFVLLLVIPSDLWGDWPRLICAGVGFAGMAGSIPAMYLFSGELFPTLGRNVGVGGVTMFARIASMIAPVILSFEIFSSDLPLIVLAVMSFAQVFLLMPLPETKDCPLPDTLEEAELF